MSVVALCESRFISVKFRVLRGFYSSVLFVGKRARIDGGTGIDPIIVPLIPDFPVVGQQVAVSVPLQRVEARVYGLQGDLYPVCHRPSPSVSTLAGSVPMPTAKAPSGRGPPRCGTMSLSARHNAIGIPRWRCRRPRRETVPDEDAIRVPERDRELEGTTAKRDNETGAGHAWIFL